jgi:O-antigen ligase
MSLSCLRDNPQLQFSCVSAACWLLSFGFALMPLDAYEAESFLLSAVFMGFAFIAGVIVAPAAKIKILLKSPVFAGVMAFWLLALVSVVASEVRAISFLYFVFFSALPLSFILFSVHSFSGILVKGAAWAVGFILCTLAMFAVVSYYALPEFLFYGQVHWPLANPNSFAGLMSFGFWGAIGGCVYSKSKSHLCLSAFHALLFFAVILMTGSVGALLALALVFPLFVAVLWRHLLGEKYVLISVFCGCLVLLGVFSGPVDQIQSHTDEAGVSVEVLSSRPAIWQSAIEIAQNHLWTGTGIGTFFLYYPEVRNVADASTAGLMAHSDPLQFAVEMGVFAPLIFYGLAILILIKMYKAMVSNAFDRDRKLLIFTSFCALLAMLLHTHVTFHLNVLSILMLSGLALAVLHSAACTCSQDVGDVVDDYQMPFAKISILYIFIIVLAVFSQLQSSQILVNRMQKSLLAGDVDTAIEQVNKADDLSLGTNARAFVAAANISIGILQLNAPLMPKDDLVSMVNDVRQLLDKAAAHNPRSPEILYARGELRVYTEPFLREDDRSGGKKGYEYFEDALALDPLHLGSRLKLVDRAIRSKDYETALVLLEEGLQWRYKSQNPRFFFEKTARLAKKLGRDDIYEDTRAQWPFYFSEAFPFDEPQIQGE